MVFKEFIGIDVGKFHIDVCIHSNQAVNQFECTKKGYNALLKFVKKHLKSTDDDQILFVMEHTGNYSLNLAMFLESKGAKFSIVPSLEISRSMGLTRGKSDVLDAKRIAQYAFRRRDEIQATKLSSDTILKMKQLLSARALLMKQKKALNASIKEFEYLKSGPENKDLITLLKRQVKSLNKDIKSIEKSLLNTINQDDKIKKQYELMCSVKGVGIIMAANMIVHTDGFQKFSEARQFASYCGVAPFPYSSGTSLKGRNKVSPLANKEIKAILHLCAVSVIKNSTEMKEYYQRKLAEGKHKMCVLNAVRNKILHRIFAVIKREKPYVDTHKYAA